MSSELRKVQFKGKKWDRIKKWLRDRNRRFEKLTRKEQRIAIAEDVIAQIKAKKLEATAGTGYLSLEPFQDEDGADSWDGDGLAEKVKDRDASECLSQVQCTVCGIGSLFVAAVEFKDKIGMADGIDSRGVQAYYLRKWFDSNQLNMIESWFERTGWNDGPISEEYDDNDRLVMIMENIVSNGGKFDPNRGKHAYGADE